MVEIKEVVCGSLSDRHGIRAGDLLVDINNSPIRDVLDYRFYLAERSVTLHLLRGAEPFSVSIRKREYDDIGLCFATPLMDEKQRCKNGCVFCFIDQNPEGMRESIYFKDDDSRLSFLHGNYITLTNMTEEDVARIVKMRFSPINVSIHTTNPELRVKMMKNKNAGKVLSYLRSFADAGLSICGQIVLCKGLNDGEELLRSMRDLSEYYPALTSVSIVPAGLTKFRDGLYPLADFSAEEAAAVIDAVEHFAEEHREKKGSRLFFLADEFYLKAGRPLPEEECYEGYPQIENGVGMLRSLYEEFFFATEDAEVKKCAFEKREISIATGVAAYDEISLIARKAEEICDSLKINVYKIVNKFFGESITVAGLLTGKDICEQLQGKPLGEQLLISKSTLRQGEDVFLCGMTVGEMEEKLSVRVRAVENDGDSLLRAMFGDCEI
jgi:putative radical SAM enzyme (TIGR03279 family)